MTKIAISNISVDPRSIEIPKRPANKTASEHRKATKPIMEKRRRARINQSLNQLKNILLEQLGDPEQKAQKLEKADILEMTVKYLQGIQERPITSKTTAVQKQKQSTQQQPDQLLNKFRAGFQQCRQQVDECFRRMQVQPALGQRLSDHLMQFERQQLLLASVPLDLTMSSEEDDQPNSPPPTPDSGLNAHFYMSPDSPSDSERSDSPLSTTGSTGSVESVVWRPW